MIDIFADLGTQRRLEVPSLDIESAPDMETAIRASGRFTCWLTKQKSGSLVRKPWRIKNGATTLGLNYLLNTGFRSVAQITTWYCGIIHASAFSGVSINDTMGSHTGWAELTGYSESVRQTWTPAAAAAGVIVNSAAMAFTINASTSAQGVFITSDSTKTGTTGTLWATAIESSSFAVTAGVVLNVIYQVTLTPVS